MAAPLPITATCCTWTWPRTEHGALSRTPIVTKHAREKAAMNILFEFNACRPGNSDPKVVAPISTEPALGSYLNVRAQGKPGSRQTFSVVLASRSPPIQIQSKSASRVLAPREACGCGGNACLDHSVCRREA